MGRIQPSTKDRRIALREFRVVLRPERCQVAAARTVSVPAAARTGRLDDGDVGGGEERGQGGGEPVDGQVRQLRQRWAGVVRTGDGDEPGRVSGGVQGRGGPVAGGEEPVAVAVVELVAACAAVDDHQRPVVASAFSGDLLGSRDVVDVADLGDPVAVPQREE